MLSQLTKTIKMALKSTEEVLRATRSALQRFPVVEWRQCMEDLHKRSTVTSRGLAGSNAWRESDCDNGVLPTAMADTDDWNLANQIYATQPEWDVQSVSDSPQLNVPGSSGQWSQDMLTPGDGACLVPETQRNMNSGDGHAFFTARGGMAESTPDDFNTFLEHANCTTFKDQARNYRDVFEG